MNILLWVLQVALAWLCIGGGTFKIFKIEDLQTTVVSMRALPHGLWALFGVVECLAAVGLILPGVLKKLPAVTPIAAAVVAVQSVIISAIYFHYGDSAPLPYAVTMALLGAFIAYGRFAAKPSRVQAAS
jgi:uncharacterized membrane protein YphA (DoxX/SURF4 family)